MSSLEAMVQWWAWIVRQQDKTSDKAEHDMYLSMLPTRCIGQQPAIVYIPGTYLRQDVGQSTIQISILGLLDNLLQMAVFVSAQA